MYIYVSWRRRLSKKLHNARVWKTLNCSELMTLLCSFSLFKNHRFLFFNFIPWSSDPHSQQSGSLSSDWCIISASITAHTCVSACVCVEVFHRLTCSFFFFLCSFSFCAAFPSIHPESTTHILLLHAPPCSPSSHCNTSMWPRWRRGVSLQVIEPPSSTLTAKWEHWTSPF